MLFRVEEFEDKKENGVNIGIRPFTHLTILRQTYTYYLFDTLLETLYFFERIDAEIKDHPSVYFYFIKLSNLIQEPLFLNLIYAKEKYKDEEEKIEYINFYYDWATNLLRELLFIL
jgi:hypothetical protein